MRKILTFIISIFLILTCSATALLAEYTEANDPFTIKISGESGHTYKAYQIFKGDLAISTTEKVLSNIVWGNGVTLAAQTEFGDAKTKAESLNESSAKAFAHQLVSGGSYLTSPISFSYNSVNSNYSANLNAGYYLIVEDSTKAYYIGVSENTTITLKHDNKPTITKNVYDGSTWTIAADAGISDEVRFKISISLPEASVYNLYTTAYALEIEDALPSGLTYKTGSLEVYKNDEITSVSTGYILDTTDASKLKISISNTKASPFDSLTGGGSLRIEYTAVLNENAILGSAGNTNSVILKYSDNPSDSESRGTTAASSSIVYTYGMDIEKVDDADNTVKLSNAKFKLFKTDGANKYYAKTGTDNYIISGWTNVATDGTEFVSDASGKIEVKGLDKGEYYLTETKAPAGYNNVSGDIEVIIDSTVDSSMGTLTGLTITVNSESLENGNVTSGIVSMTVKNKKGNILPSTGGIGTTIFYVAGGVLVAGAVVLLMLKRKER